MNATQPFLDDAAFLTFSFTGPERLDPRLSAVPPYAERVREFADAVGILAGVEEVAIRPGAGDADELTVRFESAEACGRLRLFVYALCRRHRLIPCGGVAAVPAA